MRKKDNLEPYLILTLNLLTTSFFNLEFLILTLVQIFKVNGGHRVTLHVVFFRLAYIMVINYHANSCFSNFSITTNIVVLFELHVCIKDEQGSVRVIFYGPGLNFDSSEMI